MKYILASPQGPICSMAPGNHILYSVLNCASTHYVQSLTPGTHTICTVSHIKHSHIMYRLTNLAPTHCLQCLTSSTNSFCSVSWIEHPHIMHSLSHPQHTHYVQSLTSGTHTLCTVSYIWHPHILYSLLHLAPTPELLKAEDVEMHVCAKFSRIWAKFKFLVQSWTKQALFSCFWRNLTKFCRFSVFL